MNKKHEDSLRDLAPCPFCEGQAKLREVEHDGWQVRCRRCLCSTETIFEKLDISPDSAKACVIARWNKREDGKRLHSLIFDSDCQLTEAQVLLNYAYNIIDLLLDKHGYYDFNTTHGDPYVETLAAARHLLHEATKTAGVLSKTISTMFDIMRAQDTEKAARNSTSDTATN